MRKESSVSTEIERYADVGIMLQSLSNPCASNLSVRLFSVTVRTTDSGTPAGTLTSMSNVTLTSAPTRPARRVITSSAMRLASRPTRVASSVTVP
jgi:hypothetical protein